jgi:hypothetical protein
MSRQEGDLAAYFAAARALRSELPVIRRPAITVLLDLARRATGPIRARAERALREQFGPYVVSEGLSGCAAPIEIVEKCDGNCSECPWFWRDTQPLDSEDEAVLAPEPALGVTRIHRLISCGLASEPIA